MESFLSLPRFAKGGLAVLLAVALLGWGIVAYSSKRQHDDAKSLKAALATLETKTEAEGEAIAELSDLRERLTSTETDLSVSQQAVADAEARAATVETDLADRNKAFAALEDELKALNTVGEGTDAEGAGDHSSGADQKLGLMADTPTDAGAADASTLHARLSKTMTALSARSATLAQRDRELEKVTASHDVAVERIEALETELVEEGVLRERLQTTMTALSARSATLAQRDRELEKVTASYDDAIERIDGLKAKLVEEGVLRERLRTTMTALSARSATLAQRDRELLALQAEQESAASRLLAFEAGEQERETQSETLSHLELKLDRTEKALLDGTKALAVNRDKVTGSEARLAELRAETESIGKAIEEKQQELGERDAHLAKVSQMIAEKEQALEALTSTLDSRQAEVEAAEAKLAELRSARAEVEAEISSLTAEMEQHAVMLTNKEDAIAYAETRLEQLGGELADSERRIAESETRHAQKLTLMNEREEQIKSVEASLAELKQDHSSAKAETARLRTSISDQEGALEKLKATQSELEITRTELVYQKKILKDRQEQVKLEDARLDQLQQALRDGSSQGQTFARIPIAAISRDNLAVLPIDPTYEPFPIQTPIGIRLTQVHFDMASAELTPSGLRKAKEAAAWIKEQGVEKVRLVGFTDSIGTKANNKVLAGRRAESLLRVFEQEGVDPNKIEIIAKGETGTREVTADQTAEPLNRCVGVFISAGG